MPGAAALPRRRGLDFNDGAALEENLGGDMFPTDLYSMPVIRPRSDLLGEPGTRSS
jgi:hypothetical protein